MKVAFVTREPMWGVGEHTRKLTNYLANLGVRSEIFYGIQRPQKNLDVSTSFWIRKFKQLKNFDLIHVQSSPCGAFAKIVGKPTVTTVHTTLKAELQYEKAVTSLVGLPFEKLTFLNSDKLIAVSEVVVSELVELYGYKREEIALVSNAVDTSEFDKYPDTERNSVFVMSCGRKVARKGFKYLIEACKRINVDLKIFHGELSRDELIRQYKKATIFVCPSNYESFGFTVAEAMACKCPVLCSDIPAFKGLVFGRKNGMLFEPRNVSDLSAKIALLLNDKNLREKLAQNAYQFVNVNLSWKDVAKKTLKVYEELIC